MTSAFPNFLTLPQDIPHYTLTNTVPAGEGDRPLWSLLHWAAGLAGGALFVLHVAVGRRRRP